MSIPPNSGPDKQRKSLKRTAFKRPEPAAPKSRSPLRARSRARDVLYRTIRVPLIMEAMERGQVCEACTLIADIDQSAAARCEVQAVDWHERKTRARAGGSEESLMLAANRVWTCRPCHDWIGAHPLEARDLGLVLNSWDPDPV